MLRADENGDAEDTLAVLYEDETFVRYARDRAVTIVFNNDKPCPKVWADASALLEVSGGRVLRADDWGSPQWELRLSTSPDCRTADADPGFKHVG